LIKENLNQNLINEWCEISSKITNNKWTKEQNINFVEKYNKDKFLSGKPVLEKILKEYIKDYNIDIDYVNRVKILRCGHTFHHGCITEHFNNDNKFCPLCRKAADETSSIFLGGGIN
jgi:hypothetical protein